MLGLVTIERPQSPTTVAPAPRRRPLSRELMHWLRRLHLFSGLFMLPWVMLYGLTALLFNHPGLLPDQPQRTMTLSDFASTPLSKPADPAADAADVVATLNAKFATNENPAPLHLARPEQARYAREQIAARVRGNGQEHAVLYDLPTGHAIVRTSRRTEDSLAPFATRGLKVPNSLGDRLKSSLPVALRESGLAADEAGIAVGTDLIFFAERGDKLWQATYNIQTGAVTGKLADRPSRLSPRSFLTQLHLTHGYPRASTTRWAWAIVVDAMFGVMIFWASSGVLMWWQIKSVRKLGTLVFASGILLAAVLAIAMHQVLAT
jgi:hypothetical protein